MASQLFEPLKIRDIKFKNRIFMSPMCQYSSEEGVAQPWHQIHYGTRAVGGVGLVMVEATGVSPEGRISPGDMGLWSEKHVQALLPITKFVKSLGAVPGIQIGHAGRKASTNVPWKGGKSIILTEGGWKIVAPSALAYADGYQIPKELDKKGIEKVVGDFAQSAKLAIKAGFEVIEIHMAHGYLLHEFLSPITNKRTDDYGGELENRMRLPLKIVETVRRILPANLPLFVRISATDWVAGGWDIAQSIELSKRFKIAGVDLVDCSTGGLTADAKIPVAVHFQVPFAKEIRHKSGIMTGGVGLISDPMAANKILTSEEADVVFLGRELLRNPYWALHAAKVLSKTPDMATEWPLQYLRAK